MVDVIGSTSSVHYAITGRPNCSLSATATCCVFIGIATVTLLVAFGFFLVGAWMVLPFAGAELAALFWSLRYVCLHAGDYERLTIDHGMVLVEQHTVQQDVRFELNGYWARVVLDCQPNGFCRRLALRSHGKEIEFGRYLSSEERLNVGRLLKSRLGKP